MLPVSALPHRSPMLFLDRVLEHGNGTLLAAGFIPQSAPTAHDKRASVVLGIELAAQAAALLATADADEARHDLEGYLVRVRSIQFATPSLPVEEELRVRVEDQGHAGPLRKYEIELWSQHSPRTILVRGSISTFQT